MQDKSLEHLRRLDDLLSTVLEMPEEDREAFLNSGSDEDSELRQEVMLLLESGEDVDGILDAFSGHMDGIGEPTIANHTVNGATTPLNADPYDLVGQTVSNFEIIEVIGGGGMGIVYKGKDLQLNRFVALKFLSPKLLEDAATRQRFIHEAKAASILDHPNIGIIHEIGEAEKELLFIAMTYYEGITLKELLRYSTPSLEAVLRYILSIVEGLAFSHQHGVIHRDIKPSNIVITKDDKVKIVDFGLATIANQPLLNDKGRIMGTVGYMPPEQLRGKDTDFRADIWSTGIVLHEMLYGRKPNRDENGNLDLQESQTSSSSRSPILSHLHRVMTKALKVNPDDRYPSMAAMLKDLRELLPGTFPAMSFGQIAKKTVKTRPLAVAVVTILLMLVGFSISRFTPQPVTSSVLAPAIGIELLQNHPTSDTDSFLPIGVTRELIHELTRFEGLKVVSLIQPENVVISTQDLAASLDLDWTITGDVYRKAGKIHMALSVQEVETQRIVLTTPYVDDEMDLQGLIHDVALDVVDKLNIPLTASDKSIYERSHEIDPQAFEYFLKGRFHAEQETPDHLEKAIDLFDRSLLIDPGFARAHASLVVPYYLIGEKYERIHPEAAYELAKRAAKKALLLNDQLPEAHMAQGIVRQLIENDYDGAARAFQRAIELNPQHSEVRREFGLLRLRQGFIEDGLHELNVAFELLPTSIRVRRDLARAFYYNREYDRAIAALNELLEIQPDFVRAHQFLSFSYLMKGEYEKAKEAFESAIKFERSENEIDNTGFFAQIAALSGNEVEARRRLADLISYYNTYKKQSAFGIALVYVSLTEYEEAIQWLEKSAQDGDLPPAILVDPRWDTIRDDPRFQEIVSLYFH